MNDVERRKHPRVRVHPPLSVFDVNREARMGQLIDISVDGFMSLCPDYVPINRVFQLELGLPDEVGGGIIQFGAESLWSETSNDSGKYWVGFQIIDISSEGAEKIERLISDYLKPRG